MKTAIICMKDEKQRYAHVLHLSIHISEQVQDIIYEMTLETSYSKLKEAILQRCGHSEQSMLRCLFSEAQLGWAINQPTSTTT